MRTAIVAALLLIVPAGATAKIPSGDTIEKFKEAQQLLDEDPEHAYELAKSLPSMSPADDVRLNLLVEASMRTQRVQEALDALDRLSRETADDSEAFRARLERAELLAMVGELDAADRELDALRKNKRDVSGRGADRRYLFSRLERLDHDIAKAGGKDSGAKRRARAQARKLLIHYPTELSTRRAGLVQAPDDLSDADRYVRARNLMNSWGYRDAREEFERLRKHRKYSDVANWNLGIIGLRKLRDRAEEAEKIFRRLAKKGYREQDALWYLARALMKQEKYADAGKVFDDIQKRFSRSRYTSDILYYRGWLPYDHRKNDEAIAGLEAFVNKYGRRARKSSYVYGFLAWAYMREKRWKDAIEVWNQMLPFGNTLVAGKAMYWKAYAQRELGEKQAAIETLSALRARYPLTYYGFLGEQLRAEIEGKSARASDVWWPDGGGQLDDAPRMDVMAQRFRKLDKKQARTWERVKVLALVGEQHLARNELGPIESALLAEIPADKHDEWIHALGWFVGDYNEMWDRATGGSISAPPGQPVPGELKSAMAYPRAYKDIVEGVADEFDLPPYLIWAIMRQESRYKPGAVSYTDAVGALQMIPKTARRVARDLGVTYDVRTFFRPEVGFRFSGYYMRKLLDTFDGLLVPMASSYNSGPQVVARWFQRNPEASFPWLIEEFEYNEGRAYCRKVAEHMLWYIYQYEPDVDRRNAILEKMFPLDRTIEIPDEVGY